MNREQLYLRLPVAVQNWLVSYEGRRIRRFRFGPSFDKLFGEVVNRSFWSAEQLAAYRDRRLQQFVAHAATCIPYYRDLFHCLRLRPEDIRTLDDLQQLPVLTKAEAQTHAARLHPDGLTERCLHCHTSGTTGAGLKFDVTFAAHQEQWAVWQRYRSWHGLTQDEWCLYFGGRSIVPLSQRRPPYWRTNNSGRQVLFSGYHLGTDTAAAYLDEIERRAAHWIHGYPSLISLLARYALEQKRCLPSIKWITLGAESLLPQQADVIEAAFGVRPLQHYGMAEGVANISQCPAGALHVDEDFSAVEFDPVGPDQCRVLGTNFTNPAFPLLRYEVGDLVCPADAPCSCGRSGRIVREIDGRKEDFIVTKSGALLGRLDHVFKDMINIREAQIVQSQSGHMTLRIVRGNRYTEEDTRQLHRETRQRVGDEVTFDVEFVAAVPRTKSGKLRFVVSTLTPGGETRETRRRAG